MESWSILNSNGSSYKQEITIDGIVLLETNKQHVFQEAISEHVLGCCGPLRRGSLNGKKN